MNQIVGPWTGPSNEGYRFNNEGVYELIYPPQPRKRAMYSICGNALTMATKFDYKEKITLTFSDNGNKVKFDWIDCTERVEDGAKSIRFERE